MTNDQIHREFNVFLADKHKNRFRVFDPVTGKYEKKKKWEESE